MKRVLSRKSTRKLIRHLYFYQFMIVPAGICSLIGKFSSFKIFLWLALILATGQMIVLYRFWRTFKRSLRSLPPE